MKAPALRRKIRAYARGDAFLDAAFDYLKKSDYKSMKAALDASRTAYSTALKTYQKEDNEAAADNIKNRMKTVATLINAKNWLESNQPSSAAVDLRNLSLKYKNSGGRSAQEYEMLRESIEALAPKIREKKKS